MFSLFLSTIVLRTEEKRNKGLGHETIEAITDKLVGLGGVNDELKMYWKS